MMTGRRPCRSDSNVYHDQTQPLIDYYAKAGVLREVDGTKNMEEVFNDITAILGV